MTYLKKEQLNRCNMIGTISLLLFSTTLSEGSFFLSQERSFWFEKSRNCTPATPNVKVADTDYQINERLGIDISLNENVWVGYYQVVRVFEYTGCALMSNVFKNRESQFVKIKGDPGHCFPGCGDDTVIAVTKTRCYCLGSEINVQEKTETECTDRCNDPIVACGRDNNPMKYSYLSIYKMNPNATVNIIHDATEEKDCLKMDPTIPKRFIWDKCFQFLPPMCAYGENVQTLNLTSDPKYFSWIGAASMCFQNKAFPTTYSNSKHVKKWIGSPLWTGMFKTKVVYKYDAVVPANRRQDTKYFGYLSEVSDSNVTLKFTESNSIKRTLCDDGKDDGKGIFPLSSKRPSSRESVITLSSNFSTTMANVPNTSVKSSLKTYVTVGACASVLLILVVFVSLACFFRQRKKNRGLNLSDQPNHAIGNGRNNTENSAQNSFQGNTNYFVLEPAENQIDNKKETNDSKTEQMVFDTKEDIPEYSKIKAENVYNQLDDKTTYDHAVTNNQRKHPKSSENEIDETYDRSMVVTKINFDRGHIDNIYNQSGETGEDEYNHLGPQVRKLKTDNVYGVQDKSREHMDSEYDISTCITIHCTNNEKSDNTYSFLSENENTQK